MNYKQRYKAFTFIALAFLMVFALASCSHTKVNASISGKEVYASSNGYEITNGELWNELKWGSYDTINEKIDDAILADEEGTARQAISALMQGQAGDLTVQEQKRYLDYFETLALTEAFGAAEIKDVEKYTAKELQKKTQTFIDNQYINEGKTVAADKLSIASLKAGKKTMFAGTKYETDYFMFDYYEQYVQTVAKRIYAQSVLADEIAKHDKKVDDPDDLYYNDEAIVQYQKENYQYIADRKALVIRFTNQAEIDSTYKSFGLKVYEGHFFYIPQNGKTNSEYSEYYDKFKIEDPKNSGLCIDLTALGGDKIVFELYVQMYNYIYTYRDALPTLENVVSAANTTSHRRDVTEAIISLFASEQESPEDVVESWGDADLVNNVLVKTQDALNEISDDFKFYVSKSLKINPDLTKKESRYSTLGQSYGDFYYMVFKVAEDAIPQEYYLLPEANVDDDNVVIDTTNEAVKKYKQELIEEMMWNDCDDSYISSRYDTLKKGAKVAIYDNDIEILYSSNKPQYSKTHKDAPHKDTLLTVVSKKKTTHITINEIYNELEKTSGTMTAIDLLSKKAIKATDAYKDTNKDRKDYKNNIEMLLSYFANGGISGYDSSLGKYNFLKLYFHSTDVDKIIDDTYRVNDASAKILTDFANNTAFNQMVRDYAKVAYDKTFHADAKNLLVYVDMDEDGKADIDFDWSKTIVVGGNTYTYKELAIDLINKVIIRVENSTSSAADALSDVLNEIEKCQRFTNGIDEYYGDSTLEYNPTEPESRWAMYKRAGLYIKTYDYADVTISSEESSADDSSVPATIKARLSELYKTIAYKDVYPAEYVDDEFYGESTSDGFKTDKGYNLLVITKAVVRSSAEFKPEDDVNKRFTNIVIEYDDVVQNITNIYNNGENAKSTATKDQVTLFIYEYLNYQTSSFFPTGVQGYITDFIMPVYEKYTAAASQRVLLYSKLLNSTISFTDTANNARLNEIIEINKRVSDSYLANDDESNLYENWWTTILALGDGK